MYGGRLGRILKVYPQVQCKQCLTMQVQIISYLEGDPGYKCRKCKHKFTLPFTDKSEGEL
ncbi:hypothetical protein LMH73_004800 [Vibrio splendidus]|nr:hypothetical protein [Vibrio splendidus]MCC4882548.1 hypothetical protein [Vibrio splendidus]